MNTKRFAVTGTPLELMKFEDDLLKLGFLNKDFNRNDVFNFRSGEGKPAEFITIACHIDCQTPVHFVPAANNGNADMYDGVLILPAEYNKALKFAKLNAEAVLPVLTTEDGKKLFVGDRFFFIKKNFTKGTWATITKRNYKLFDDLLAFSTEEIADAYINTNKKIFSKEDIFAALEAAKTDYMMVTSEEKVFPVVDTVEFADKLSLFN